MKKSGSMPKLKVWDRYFDFLSRRSPFDKFLFHIALLAAIFCGLYLAITINTQYLTTVPTKGGVLVEGIIGTPRFVNPALAITRADQDMVSLVYSGLMKLDTDGILVPDVAESIERSEDGSSYAIKIRDDVYFHDGSQLKAEDVAFTINLFQNPDLKSPFQSNWDGVEVEVVDEFNLTITLKESYAPFIENLTFGIMPKALWSSLPVEQIPFSQINTEPIGTGPYQVTDVERTPSGLISAYKLTASKNSTYQDTNITTLVFQFYSNQDQLLKAIEAREISGTPSLSTEVLSQLANDSYNIVETPLPRTFGIYFNQNRSVATRDEAARKALSTVINRDEIIDKVLDGFGIPTTSPIPPGFIEVNLSTSTPAESTSSLLAQAREILETGGWAEGEDGKWTKKIGEEETVLSITLTTANTDIFRETAELVADYWRELGVEVKIDQFEQTDLIQGIIRPRDFEAMLYGADVGRSLDLYPFWHSSQKSDPGLNISQYTNIETDGYLQDIRTQSDIELRNEAIYSFDRIITSELPAIFIFTPTFGYVVDKDVYMTDLTRISKQSERFANISSWHIKSNHVWPVFSNK